MNFPDILGDLGRLQRRKAAIHRQKNHYPRTPRFLESALGPGGATKKGADIDSRLDTLQLSMADVLISPVVLLVVYCGLTLLASLAGGWLPLFVRLTHTRLQVATSFVAGLMLGVAILHLLPHAWHEFQSIDRTVAWLLGGFLVMFFIQRFFHFHHHDVPDEAPESSHAHEPCGHVHEPTLAHKSAGQLSWGGAALGLTLHSLIDGIALAASVEAESQGQRGWAGLATFAVIILHKPFDAMAIGTLMAAGGRSRMSRHVVNIIFSLVIPVGVVMFHLGAHQFAGPGHLFLGAALAFAAGTFLCIAASDLLPELQFHSHDRGKLSLALMAGLVFAALIGRIEHTGHGHDHGPPGEQREGGVHDHDDHDGHAH